MSDDDERLEAALRDWLQVPGPMVLAFSGGVDSSYLLAVAVGVRGPAGIEALLGVSPSLSDDQRRQAHLVAAGIGVAVTEVPTAELDRPEYRANQGDRCYFCKDTLFAALRRMRPGALLLDGSQADDRDGHRPGRRAALEHHVRSPLLELGLDKAFLRRRSRLLGLPTADLPAAPCLASRFPAGEPVDAPSLARVERAEAYLRSEGFREFRVRHHGDLARLEVPLDELHRFSDEALRSRCVASLRTLGYRFVTFDLAGFRSGSGSLPV